MIDIDYKTYAWKTVEVSIRSLKEIIENAVLDGGEGLINIDSDDLDQEAVDNIVDNAMEKILEQGYIQ